MEKYSELIKMLKMEQTDLMIYMMEFLESVYRREAEINHLAQFLYMKGDVPICLVAHLDKVGAVPTELWFNESKTKITAGNVPLGADDRAGVYAILELVRCGLKPHILLTTDEEIGGIGAKAFALEPSPDIKYYVEIDRRGDGEAVFYDCGTKAFQEYVESFGFKTNQGSYSDICELMSAHNKCGVNVSAGYSSEHSNAEVLDLNALEKTIDRVGQMILCAHIAPQFVYEEDVYMGWGNYGHEYTYSPLKSSGYKRDYLSYYYDDYMADDADYLDYDFTKEQDPTVPKQLTATWTTSSNRGKKKRKKLF